MCSELRYTFWHITPVIHQPTGFSELSESQQDIVDQPQARTPLPRRWIGVLIGLAISVSAIYLVLQWTGWDPLVEAFERVDLRFVLGGVIVFLISMVARALCWRELLARRFSLLQVLSALNEGYLLNNILPWRLGEFGRAVLLGRKGDGVLRVLSTIFVERMFDVFIALSILIGLLPSVAGIPEARRTGFFLAGILIVGTGVVWFLLRESTWIERIFDRLPGSMARLSAYWRRIQSGFLVLRDPGRFLRSFAWILTSWMLAGLQYWLVLKSVMPDANLLWAYFLLTVTLLGIAVPSSPGFIGVFEAAGVLALSVFGVPRAEALAASLLIHAMVYILGSAFGAVALSSEGETIIGIYRDIRTRVLIENRPAS